VTRSSLPTRRFSITRKIMVELDNGKEIKILITIGFHDGRPCEVFCADFKAGTALHGIVIDACILFSRLLQHGDSPAELVASMCQGPSSLVGAIATAVSETTLGD